MIDNTQPIAYNSGSEPRGNSHVVMAGVAGPLLPQTISRKKKRYICVCLHEKEPYVSVTLRAATVGNRKPRKEDNGHVQFPLKPLTHSTLVVVYCMYAYE